MQTDTNGTRHASAISSDIGIYKASTRHYKALQGITRHYKQIGVVLTGSILLGFTRQPACSVVVFAERIYDLASYSRALHYATSRDLYM